MREAAVVVCHGGPGTIMLAATMGKRPIVVPAPQGGRRARRRPPARVHAAHRRRRRDHPRRVRVRLPRLSERRPARERRRAAASPPHPPRGRRPPLRGARRAPVRAERDRRRSSARPCAAGESARRYERRPRPLHRRLGPERVDAPLPPARRARQDGLGRRAALPVAGRARPRTSCAGAGSRSASARSGRRSARRRSAAGTTSTSTRCSALEADVLRHRNIPLLALPRLFPEHARKVDRYAELTARVYAAILTVSGAEIVVDSTKNPPYAYFLRRAPGVGLRVLHLVRDSRGVVHSWMKRVERPEITGRRARTSRSSARGAPASAGWSATWPSTSCACGRRPPGCATRRSRPSPPARSHGRCARSARRSTCRRSPTGRSRWPASTASAATRCASRTAASACGPTRHGGATWPARCGAPCSRSRGRSSGATAICGGRHV